MTNFAVTLQCAFTPIARIGVAGSPHMNLHFSAEVFNLRAGDSARVLVLVLPMPNKIVPKCHHHPAHERNQQKPNGQRFSTHALLTSCLAENTINPATPRLHCLV